MPRIVPTFVQPDEVSDDEVLADEGEPPSTVMTSAPASATASLKTSPRTTAATADLLRAAADPALTEDFALALLKRADLPAEVLEQLAKNVSALKSRKVKIALAGHAHTPRHVSVPLARQFYTFDLVKLALSPGVPADVRVAVDDVLISRLKTVTVGERLTLARRASGRVAAALLLNVAGVGGKAIEAKGGATKVVDDKAVFAKTGRAQRVTAQRVTARTAPWEPRIMLTALDNPRLTEGLVINSVLRPGASPALVHGVARHEKWSRRKEIRAALLRTEHLSLARALEFSREIPAALLQELLSSSRLPEKIKELLLREKLT